MIRTSRPPCAIRECLFYKRRFVARPTMQVEPLNALLGLVVALFNIKQIRSASGWAAAAFWIAALGFEPVTITCGKRRRGTRGTRLRASRRHAQPPP